jgi:starch-binding outer membrane protein, SusD/RagB family
MKKVLLFAFMTVAVISVTTTACKESFLEKEPQGVLSPTVLANSQGLNALLIAAYAQLDGWAGWDAGDMWRAPGTNWVYGDVAADDSYKGSDAGDQADIRFIELYQQLPGNAYFSTKWLVTYDAVSRSNDVLRVLEVAKANGTVGDDEAVQIEAEAKFLRAYYHLEGIKIFDYIPYVLEDNNDGKVENKPASTAPSGDLPWGQMEADGDIPWEGVEADLTAAIAVLPESPRNGEVGRATKFAATALLAKVKMFQGKYNEALPLLNQIITSGKYSLAASYHDNFRIAGQTNNPETIFAIQHSINDNSGAESHNGNSGDMLNFPYNNGPGGCCGFNQPSQNLVNTFRTDANGLPYLNNDGPPVVSDQGLLSSEPFTPDAGPLDPRLDWAVGRRGIPYLDWGPHGGSDWIRDQNEHGPYAPKKVSWYKSENGTGSNAGGWGGGTSAINYNIIRYADVLLWAAECEVEIGSLEVARGYVNQLRARAANPATWVKNPDGSNAANYVIGLYNTPWADKDVARKAVRTERRIELAMEGHRFWDLKRWGGLKTHMNNYFATEKLLRAYMAPANVRDPNVRHPVPTTAIDRSEGSLLQNPGY